MYQTAEHGHLSTFPAPSLSLLCLQPFNPKHACSATSWHLLVLAPLPGILSPNLSILESHLLHEVFHDYPYSRPNMELDLVSSGLSWPFPQAVGRLSQRSWSLSQFIAKSI